MTRAAAIVCETERLLIRHLTLHDAAFIVRLLNEPSFLRFIGDRGVRTEEDAVKYLKTGPLDSYRRHGFGLFAVARREDGHPLGICGLLKREALDDVDIGFAFERAHWGRGYALEASTAIMDLGFRTLGLPRIVAITAVDNDASMRLLHKLGFGFLRRVQLSQGGEELNLFLARSPMTPATAV